MHNIFSNDWAGAWQDQLNANGHYKEAAKKWNKPVILRLSETDSACFADLLHGECLTARVASDNDLQETPIKSSAKLAS